MGDDEISSPFQDKLKSSLNEFHSNLTNTSRFWDQQLQEYNKSMQQSIDASSTYYKAQDFKNLHEQIKNRCINQVGVALPISPFLNFVFRFWSFLMLLNGSD